MVFIYFLFAIIIIMINQSYDVLHQKQKTNFTENTEPNPNTLSLRRFLRPPPRRGHVCTADGSTVHDLIFRTRPSSKQNERAYLRYNRQPHIWVISPRAASRDVQINK